MAFPSVPNTSYVLFKTLPSVVQLHCGFKVRSSPPAQGIQFHVVRCSLAPCARWVPCLAHSAAKGQALCQVRFLPSAGASDGVTWLQVLLVREPQLVTQTHLSFWLVYLALPTPDAFLITHQKVTDCQKAELLSEKQRCRS